MAAYYNEIDPYAAAWLRNLIAAGHIAPGDVDERSILDVRPSELRGYEQCHFFAGIGVWSRALRLATWADDRPVWTGSCPCQPFSAAGKGGGFADERHLWPAWHHLIRECRPATVLGEQVASKDGLGWLDLVHADLEGEGYAVGAVDLCAAGVGAPHIRQRLWFVADAIAERSPTGARQPRLFDGAQQPERPSVSGLVADAADTRQLGRQDAGADRLNSRPLQSRGQGVAGVREPERGGDAGLVGDADSAGSLARRQAGSALGYGGSVVANGRIGFWSVADWIPCRDGKARPVEPGTFPLAHGAPARVGRLRAYGNAICAEAAKAFIQAADAALADRRNLRLMDIFG